MIEERIIHIGWETLPMDRRSFRIMVECEDEMTEIVLFRPTPELQAVFLTNEDTPELIELLNMHVDKCSRCGPRNADPPRLLLRDGRPVDAIGPLLDRLMEEADLPVPMDPLPIDPRRMN